MTARGYVQGRKGARTADGVITGRSGNIRSSISRTPSDHPEMLRPSCLGWTAILPSRCRGSEREVSPCDPSNTHRWSGAGVSLGGSVSCGPADDGAYGAELSSRAVITGGAPCCRSSICRRRDARRPCSVSPPTRDTRQRTHGSHFAHCYSDPSGRSFSYVAPLRLIRSAARGVILLCRGDSPATPLCRNTCGPGVNRANSRAPRRSAPMAARGLGASTGCLPRGLAPGSLRSGKLGAHGQTSHCLPSDTCAPPGPAVRSQPKRRPDHHESAPHGDPSLPSPVRLVHPARGRCSVRIVIPASGGSAAPRPAFAAPASGPSASRPPAPRPSDRRGSYGTPAAVRFNRFNAAMNRALSATRPARAAHGSVPALRLRA